MKALALAHWPRMAPPDEVRNQVLKAIGCVDVPVDGYGIRLFGSFM